MSLLHVPDAHAGMNAFAVPTWWASLEDERVTRDDDERPDVTVVEVDLDADRTLLVVGAVAELLSEPTPEGLAAWVAEVRAVHTAEAPVHLAVSLDEVTSLDELLTLAAGRRWPRFDVAAAAAHTDADPIPPQSVPGGQDTARAYADAIVAQVEVLLPPAWQTAVDGTADATACISRALDTDPDLGPAEARAMRDACRAALAALEADGVTVSGPRDALLWPVPAERGLVPLDVAADAALEVMLGQVERPADLAPDRAVVVPLAELPARALLTRLRGTR
ncbi:MULTISPECIES: hypothetical protein [unclassified Nocardioides]|uniref:hypothetical protein n=1 Tax=unclassified Nocardioides TaxID=2615069 RepID=UPI00114FF57C|nr:MULTISPECIES: hypothetical protein [unclassified Nocardioides]TQK73179.1 hypothetical protein FBY23_5005 [Nocardioides sp. SLBN-35]WGY02583.1 hypothetical protein QI633_02230 [Nocardioides sp. QY071]